MRAALRIRNHVVRLVPLVVMLLAATRPCAAVTVTAVHVFGGTDGSHPMAGLFLGADGKFYGTTTNGGSGVAAPAGTVFRVASNGDFTSLFTFDFQVTGDEPFGGIAADADGNLYGTTRGSGSFDGNVFELGASFTDLHDFAGYILGPDGSHPESAPTLASDGNLYGVTPNGGNYDVGSVYRITTSNGTYAMIHSFNGSNVPAEGYSPRGALVNGSDDNLYGTTAGGGPSGAHGTVFKMTTAGVVTTLHTFVGTDGDSPLGTLVQATDGNFYGTTAAGGAHSFGTVFRISPSGDFTSLYSFGSAAGDGYSPSAGLVQASDGYLYGTTASGGDYIGTVFRMSLDGTPETIYSFEFAGAEGYGPHGWLVEGPDGNLYGTTRDGGAGNDGAVFKLTPSLPTTTTATSSTTTSSTSSSTHASVTTTSSTSTTALASTTTSPVTTSTAVAIPAPTTTSTLPAGPCAGTPSGPTFPSIRCRLVALRDQVSGEPGLGSYAPKLEKNLDKAVARLDDAKSHCTSAAGTKKAKSRLVQVMKALTQYAHRLSGLAARKKLDSTLRQTFVGAGSAITPDVTMLRAQLVCPSP